MEQSIFGVSMRNCYEKRNPIYSAYDFNFFISCLLYLFYNI